MLTKYYLETANYYNALRESLFILEKTSSSSYEIKARKTGKGIAAKYLNDSQLQKLYSLFTSKKVKSFAKSTFSDLMNKIILNLLSMMRLISYMISLTILAR